MNIKKITNNITIKPTDRKIKKVKHFIKTSGILPKEMPIEKKIYLETSADMFEREKDKIQITLDKYRGLK